MQFFQKFANLHDKNYIVVNVYFKNCFIDINENLKINDFEKNALKKICFCR